MSDQNGTNGDDDEPREGTNKWLKQELAKAQEQLAKLGGQGQIPFHERAGAVTINAKGEVQQVEADD